MEITGDVRITFAAGGWLVNSQTSSDKYAVNPSATAPWCGARTSSYAHLPCKHILAVRLLLERQLRGDPNPARNRYRHALRENPPAGLAELQSRTDERKGPVPGLACGPVPAAPELPLKNAEKGGRPPLPIADAVFAAVFKVYSTFGTRRFMSDLRRPTNAATSDKR